jgi:hypothetical protein
MAAPKGNNFGKGRPKGAPNKANREIRDILREVCQKTIDDLDSILEQIEAPKDRIDALSKLMPYFVSKMPNVNINATSEIESIQPPNITYNVVDMSVKKDGI